MSRILLFGALIGLLGAPALAQPKSRRPAAAQPQAPVGQAKEDDSPPPPSKSARSAQVVSAAEADRALLRGLLWVYEPAPVEIRVQAVEDLALLGDARALNVLASLILDPNAQVQMAAVRAVRAFQAPRAEEILQNVVRHPRTPEALKIHALQSLAFQRSPTAREFLEQVVQNQDGRYNEKLSSTAQSVLLRASDAAPPSK